MVRKKKSEEEQEYNADSIQHLSSHNHLLKRLSLTFGNDSSDDDYKYSIQKSVALRELQDNATDEIAGGHGSRVGVSFFADYSFEVKDSGRGIPVGTSVDGNGNKVSGIYKSLGLINSGGKFVQSGRNFSSGMNGVGASSTIHCSRRADVTVYQKRKKYQLSFKDGIPGFFDQDNDPESAFSPLDDLSFVKESKDDRTPEEKKLYPTGTTVRVWLRDEIFQSNYPYDDQDLIDRMKSTCYLLPQMEVSIYNELNLVENPETGNKEPQQELFHFENGLEDLLERITPDTPVTEIVSIEGESRYIEKNAAILQSDGSVVQKDVERFLPVKVLFHYGDQYGTSIDSYVNTIHTRDGGVHEDAFLRALVDILGDKIKSMRGFLTAKDPSPSVDDFKEGLSAIVAVNISEPKFKNQTKDLLEGADVKRTMVKCFKEELQKWVDSKKNYDQLKKIATKVTTATKNRQKALEQREINRQKNQIKSASLPVKLIDCKDQGSENSELYICEGDSACGLMKAARDAKNQALLPIRGKFTNAFKEAPKTVLSNGTVQDIILALGAGSGSTFDISKCRYERIFFATDADPDGHSIAVLLYGLFWKYFKPLIDANRVFIASVPLFTIEVKDKGKKSMYYAQDEAERDEILQDLSERGITVPTKAVKRMKGLGEMNAEDLWTTSMNPETRTVIQIVNEDDEKTEKTLDITLGKDSEKRKEWITNSKEKAKEREEDIKSA